MAADILAEFLKNLSWEEVAHRKPTSVRVNNKMYASIKKQANTYTFTGGVGDIAYLYGIAVIVDPMIPDGEFWFDYGEFCKPKEIDEPVLPAKCPHCGAPRKTVNRHCDYCGVLL